jgi:DNA-directed RNA polymerase specialized sigma24 family protein
VRSSLEFGRKWLFGGVSRLKRAFDILCAGFSPVGEVAYPTTADLSNEELGWLTGHHSSEAIQREAFDELFRRLWSTSLESARSAGAHSQYQAEDAATQAWLRAWRYRHRYDRAKARYLTWLGAIVRNETLDLVKAELRHRVTTPAERDLPDSPDTGSLDDPDLIALSFVWEAFDALRRAKPEFAAVLSLKAQGYRDKQIGLRLGLGKVGTVASRLSRAKRFMAEWLASQGVVFLSQSSIGCVHPRGLNPLCKTEAGTFFGYSPLDGIFALPTGHAAPPGAILLCCGFFTRVWSYPTRDFRVIPSDQDPPEGTQVVFKWSHYLVVKRHHGLALPVNQP